MSLVFNDGALTIASGEALSTAAGAGQAVPLALQMPAAWTAAALTLQASMDGSAWLDVYDGSGNEITITVDASRHVVIDGTMLAGVKYFRLRSGTSGAPVNQAAQRSIVVIARKERNR